MSTTASKRNWQQATQDAIALRNLLPAAFWERWEVAGSVRRRRPEVGDVEYVVIPKIESRKIGLFTEDKPANVLWERVEEMLALGSIAKHVYHTVRGDQFRWGDKYRGIEFRGFNHEIFLADARNWGSVLAIRTGPAELSKDLVTGLQRRGFINRGGYVRNKREWACTCTWRGPQPNWVPMEKHDYMRTDNTGPACPLCRGSRDVEPVIVDCPDEQTFFDMAGVAFIQPEKR